MRRLVLPMTAAAVFFAILFSSMPAPALAQVVPGDVQQAALAGDWNKVWTALGAEKTNPEPAELRLIKGHACLALNYNNQSLELFASALNDTDRKAWQTWAHAFAKAHERNAIAWYFEGDAHARFREWEPAAQCFDKAIELDTQCYLALNARGVVTHAVGNTLAARVYFLKATKAKENFADGYASRGTLNVLQKNVKAEDEFKEAKTLSRDRQPALPLLGLGCVHYGKRQYDDARKCFSDDNLVTCLLPLARENLMTTEMASLGQRTRKGEVVGVSLRAVLSQNGDDEDWDDSWWDYADRIIDQDDARLIHLGPRAGSNLDTTWWIQTRRRDGSWTRPRRVHLRDHLRESLQQPVTGTDTITPVPEELLPDSSGLTIRFPALAVARQFAELATVLRAASDSLAAQIARTRSNDDVGGATSDVSGVAVNRDKWGVYNVYGLLYAVPVSTTKKTSQTSADR